MRPPRSIWAPLSFPSRYQLGLERLADLAGWRHREDDGVTLVSLDESYQRSPSRMLVVQQLAGDDTWFEASDGLLRSLSAQDAYIDADLRQRVESRSVDRGRPEDVWASYRLGMMTRFARELPEFVRAEWQGMAAQIEGASLWLVRIRPELIWRFTAVRALFAAEHTPEILEATDAGFPGFRTGEGLTRAIQYGLSAYIEPCLLALSPFVIGVNGARIDGQIVSLFGDSVVPGLRNESTPELINLFHPSWAVAAPGQYTNLPVGDDADTRVFLGWWVSHLDEFLGRLLDPARFVGDSGCYEPQSHMAVLMSVERLFQGVLSILSNSRRDELSRLSAMFDCLDILEGLDVGSFDNMTSQRRAHEELESIEQSLSPAVRDLATTRARAAVQALHEVREGFFIGRDDAAEHVTVHINGRTATVPLDAAVRRQLRLMRNSTHSFRRIASDADRLAILAAHTGEVAPELADLAYFHLLRVLVRPELMFPALRTRQTH